MNKVKLIGVYLLISLTGMLIRLAQNASYSVYPTGFNSYGFYHVLYVLKNGHLLNYGEMYFPTRFSSGIEGLIPLKSLNSLHAIIYLVIGVRDINDILFFDRIFPLIGSFLLPLSGVMVAEKIASKYQESNPFNLALVFGVSCFTSFSIITLTSTFMTDAALGYLLLILSYYSLLEKSIMHKICLLLFAVSFPLFYHTAAITYFILLSTAFALQLLKKERIIENNYIIFYSVFFLVYLMYLAFELFNNLTIGATKIIQHLLAQEKIGMIEHAPITAPNWWMSLNYLHGFLVLFFIFLFIYLKMKRKQRDSTSSLLMYWNISLVPVTVVFFVWRGLRGALTRGDQYANVLFILTLPSLFLLIGTKKMKALIRFLILFTIVISITSYSANVTNQYVDYFGHMDQSSEKATIWCANHIKNSEHIFTDFRMGTSLVLFDHFNITGIIGDMKEDKEYLSSIYYENDSFIAKEALFKFNADYLLLSKEMTKKVPGITGWGYQFPPAPENYMEKYDSSSFFNKIYNNAESLVYLVSIRKSR